MVKKLDAANLDAHKKIREEHKSTFILFLCVTMYINSWFLQLLPAEDTRYTNPLKRKFRAKREMDGGAAVPVSKRPNVQMPDEYLPPNKILFLQNLPENVTKDQLMALFAQYVHDILYITQ